MININHLTHVFRGARKLGRGLSDALMSSQKLVEIGFW
jgi:hypothetical protein